MNNIISSVGIAYKIIDTPINTLRFSIGPSFEWSGGGRECSLSKDCDVILPGGILGAMYKWQVNKNVELLLENNFRSRFISDISTSNQLETSIRYFPTSDSNFYTALSYENDYNELNLPKFEHNYKIKLGTRF